MEAAQLVGDTLQYGQRLLGRVHEPFALEAPAADRQYRVEARSVAFRRIVVEAYTHACALCGVRLLTPEGRTAVVAAHIVPWRVTHNDDPRNGLALCGLHHWTFDEGLVTVDRRYTVKVSPAVSADEGSHALRQLAEGGMRLPSDPDLHRRPSPWRGALISVPIKRDTAPLFDGALLMAGCMALVRAIRSAQ